MCLQKNHERPQKEKGPPPHNFFSSLHTKAEGSICCLACSSSAWYRCLPISALTCHLNLLIDRFRCFLMYSYQLWLSLTQSLTKCWDSSKLAVLPQGYYFWNTSLSKNLISAIPSPHILMPWLLYILYHLTAVCLLLASHTPGHCYTSPNVAFPLVENCYNSLLTSVAR